MRPNLPSAITASRHPGSSLVVNIGFAAADAFPASGGVSCLPGLASGRATSGSVDSFSLGLNATRCWRARRTCRWIASEAPIAELRRQTKRQTFACARKSREAPITRRAARRK